MTRLLPQMVAIVAGNMIAVTTPRTAVTNYLLMEEGREGVSVGRRGVEREEG